VRRVLALCFATLLTAAPAAAAPKPPLDHHRGLLPRIQFSHGYAVDVTGASVVSEPGRRVMRLERRPRAGRVGLVVTPKP
jgi:hypothetical protein